MEDNEKIQKCMDLTVEFWNTFVSIKKKHSMDEQETCRDIHDLQNRLFSIAHKNEYVIKNQR